MCSGREHRVRSSQFRPIQFEHLESRLLLTITNVPANGNLQTYINNALPGDTLVLPNGATYTGNFTLPNKSGTATITIQSSSLASLPAGVRVGTAQAGLMAKIQTNNTTSVLVANPSSHNYAFLGIEFTTSSSTVSQGDLIKLGTSGTAQDTLAEVPTDFLFDRCYLHGYPVTDYKRGIALNSANTTISNCYFSDFHSTGQDAQALSGWNGPGNFTITNNYLEASGENIIFGGSDATIPNLVPTNIVIRGNLFSKPLTWNPNDPTFAGTTYVVKNLFELKNAQNVTVDQNIFQNNWSGGQAGFAILFKSANQDGGNPWAVTANVTFTNNIIRHSGNAFNYINVDGTNTAVPIHDIRIANNLFYDIGGAEWGANGFGFQMLKGLASGTNVTIEHNTLFGQQNFLVPDAGSATNKTVVNNFIFQNNLVEKGLYGAKGGGTAEGTTTLQTFYPGYTFAGNVIIGGSSSIYPAGNFFPANDTAVGFTDFTNHKYYLAPSSTLKNKATDGTDPGVNWNNLDPEFLQEFDTTAPKISALYVRGAAWSTPFLNYLASSSQGDATLGYRIPTGPNQLNTLPWADLNQLAITFNENVTLAQAALTLTGLSATYPSSTFSYNTTTHTAIWTFANPLPTDKLQIAIPAASVTDTAGNQLDGEWTDNLSTTSGNGTAGGNFQFHLNVLPGDTNHDNIVDGLDFNNWFNNLETNTFDPAKGDLNADGLVDGLDFNIWFSHLEQSLTSPASPATLTQPLTAAASAPLSPTTPSPQLPLPNSHFPSPFSGLTTYHSRLGPASKPHKPLPLLDPTDTTRQSLMPNR